MKPLYAVRHIPSGSYLPTRKKSFTVMEPQPADVVPPRLHVSYKRAAMAMHAWVRGHHIATWEWWSSDDPYSSAGGPYVDDIRIKPVSGRNIEHMEIVEIHLHVRENVTGEKR